MSNKTANSNNTSPDNLISTKNSNSGKENYDTKKEPRKSMGVYLKNQNRLIMNSIAIADKKAAILIRITLRLYLL